jgi:hypothetical protein
MRDYDFLATAIKERGASQMPFGVKAPGGRMNNHPGTDRTADDIAPMIAGRPTRRPLTEQDKIDTFPNNPARIIHKRVDVCITNVTTKLRVLLASGETSTLKLAMV